MLNIFRKKMKILTSHERAITVMYLQIKANELQREVDSRPDDDTRCIQQDIQCLKNAMEYLDH